MGWITTFSIYNDGIDLIKENPKEFAEKIYDTALNSGKRDLSIQHFANLVRVQKSRHSSDIAIYAHAGNCVTEISIDTIDEKKGFHRKLLGILQKDIDSIVESMSPESLFDSLIEDTGLIPKNKLPEKLHNNIVAEKIKGTDNESIDRYLSQNF